MALFGGHDDALADGKAGGVQRLQEGDALQILSTAILVGLIIGAAIVQIHHGADRIHTQTVEMEFLQPVHCAGNEEALDLRTTEIKDAGGPVGMLVHLRILQFVAAGAVELVKAVQILGEVGRHPVQQHTDAGFMQGIHKDLQFIGGAVTGGGGVIIGDLITPAGIEGVGRQGHNLHMGKSHFLDIFGKQGRNLGIGIAGAVFLPLPGTHMELIDVHRALQRVFLGSGGKPLTVAPLVIFLLPNHAGGVRHQLGAVGIGVYLVDRAAIFANNQEFIGLSQLSMGSPGFPNTAGDLLHGKILAIPEVKVAHNCNTLCIGRPNAENKTGLTIPCFGVATHMFKGMGG